MTVAAAAASAAPIERTPAEIAAQIRAARDDADDKLFAELAGLRTREALAALIDALGAVGAPAKLKPAYHSFRAFRGVEDLEGDAIEYLASRAAAQSNQKGVHAALALIELLPSSADELAALALESKHVDVRTAALIGVVAAGDSLDERDVAKLANSKLLEVRFEGLLAQTRRIDDVEKRDRAIARLHSSRDEAERLAAVELLAAVDCPQRFTWLARSLGDEYGPVRRKAVDALERAHDLRAVEQLIARLAVARPGEAWTLARALERITGLSLGSRAETWKRWWDREGASFVLPGAGGAAPAPKDDDRTTASFYGLPIPDQHVVLAVDTSDSMKADDGRADRRSRIAIAKEQMRAAIEAFSDDATFEIVDFGKSARSWRGELVEARKRTKTEALEWVASLALSWGTEIHGGLRQAFRDPSADAIVFLTDGDPQLSVLMDRPTILRLVAQWNRTRCTRIDCLSIGTDRPWLRALAESSNGRYRQVN